MLGAVFEKGLKPVDDLLFPLTIVALNLLTVLVLSIVKDVINNVMFGETELVLQKLSTNRNPARSDTPHVEITGRRAGLMGAILTLFDLSPKVTLSANSEEIRKSSTSLNGHAVELIPLTPQVSVQAHSRRSVLWLFLAIFCLTGGVGYELLSGDSFKNLLLNALAWLAAAGVYVYAFYLSHTFQLSVHGSINAGVSFKPNVLEGRMIHFDEVILATEILLERIQESRSLGTPVPILSEGYPPPEPNYAPGPTPAGDQPVQPPQSPYTPPIQLPGAGAAEETITQKPNHRTAPAASQQPATPNRTNTGTVEYGDDHPPFESGNGAWDGSPEPGTSDSIQMRQSVSRSETGMFLGLPSSSSEYDAEELDDDDDDTDDTGGTHRGTVSWEDQTDNTQNAIKAEAELADLKASRPTKGEAKFKLRDLIRRFPGTEAAIKASRMLEKLEAGQ